MGWGHLLRCEACGKEPRSEEEAHRWRAYLTVIEEGDPEEVIVYCPGCVKRELEAGELGQPPDSPTTAQVNRGAESHRRKVRAGPSQQTYIPPYTTLKRQILELCQG
jgi:hypothetical protein